MPEPEIKLILAPGVQQDMLSYTRPLGDQIEAFILQLAENPFDPDILKVSVDNHDGSYEHKLASGCLVFWEIFQTVEHPRFGTLEGTVVRVTGARFDFGAR